MKKLVITLISLVAILFAGIAGTSFFLKGSVEDLTREALIRTAASFNAEVSIGSVSFSPLSREITITNIRTRQNSPQGVISGSTRLTSATVPVKVILAMIPSINNFLFKDGDLIPVLENVVAHDFQNNGPEGYKVTTKLTKAELVKLDYSLFKEFLVGSRPPFIQVASGIYISQATSYDTIMDIKVNDEVCRLKIDSMSLLNAHGPSAQLFRLNKIVAPVQNGALRIDEISFHDIKISPSLFSELVAISELATSSKDDFSTVERALKENGPIITRTSVRNVSCPITTQGELFTLGELTVDWKQNPELLLDFHIRSVTLPSSLAQLANIKLPGIQSIVIDADHSVNGIQHSTQKGLLRVNQLFEINYSFIWLPQEQGVKDLYFSLSDYGAMAYAALNIAPNPEAGALLLKTGVAQLCSKDDASEKKDCEKLAQFVDAPGKLSLQTIKGKVLTLENGGELLLRFGTNVELSVQPGPHTLSEQVRALLAK